MFADPAQAAFFSWPGLGIFSVVGLIGVWISQYTILREAWEQPFSIPKGVLAPILAGIVLAVILVGIDLLTGYTKFIVARRGLTQQYTGFLPMLLAFSGAAIVVEVVYRMLFLPLLLWLVAVVVLRRRYQEHVFWVLAVLTSFLEPLTQFPDLQVLPVLTAVIVGLVFISLNFTQASFWRRYGFLSAILVRVGFYFVWHALYIH